jgi:alpha-tubulin suppressor-like RCC1 family protein
MLSSAGRAFVGALAVAAVGCGGQISDDASPGCLAGNRSQCVMQAALGDHFACARLHDHSVWCWGSNAESQLGYGTTDVCPIPLPDGQTQSFACHTYPFQVVGLGNVALVAAGSEFACAVKADGSVWCWGSNSAGQLGNGGAPSSMQPVQVPSVTNAKALALGAHHACALSDGNVLCWGADDQLQLGVANPSTTCNGTRCETTPHQVMGLGHVTAIAAGDALTCAVADDG